MLELDCNNIAQPFRVSNTSTATTVDYTCATSIILVEVGIDLDGLAAQVEANTEAIEALTTVVAMNTAAIDANTDAIGALAEIVAMLATEVEGIKEALEDLGDEVANHTHSYLTGKGVGHNNTVAETGKPVGEDDAEVQPVKTNRGRSKKFVR